MNPQGSPLQGATGASGEADTLPVLRVADGLESYASPTRLLSADHAQLLHGSAIDVEVAREAGVCSVRTAADLPPAFRGYGSKVVPALAFSYTGLSGEAVPQLRPERPGKGAEGSQVRYLFPSGVIIPMTVHPRMRSLVLDRRCPLVVVEGTKQYLAAVSALGAEDAVAVVGMSGCWGWSHDHQLTPSWLDIPLNDRSVCLVLDADRTTNRKVYDAAAELTTQLIMVRGAAEVRYASLPTSGTSGLDDVLALAPPAERAAVLGRILGSATTDPGERPDAPGSKYFDSHGLRVQTWAEDILDEVPLAVGVDGCVHLYRDGVYTNGQNLLLGHLCSMLGERYRPTHANAVIEYLTAQLTAQGRLLPDTPPGGLLNLANGMLDLTTLELREHDPALLSSVQLPVAWDPSATAPTYERWLGEQAGEQADDLEETAATMLDSSRTPTKAPFLFGPTKSGKSTFLRLMVAVAGKNNSSSVSLHQLSTNRFTAAELHGKILNCAADLSYHHVDDLSMFKLLTGGDLVFAERKFGQPFTFTNHALIAFSANEIPSVGETSNAYLERIKPFLFGASFAGKEDPNIELQMVEELPGILARWVHALHRLRLRGAPLPTTPDVAAMFANRSDRVRMFLDEMTAPDQHGTTRKDLYNAFKVWGSDTAGPTMSRNKFLDRVRLTGVEEYRHGQRGWCFRVKTIDPDRDEAASGPAPVQRAGLPTPSDSCDSSFTSTPAAASLCQEGNGGGEGGVKSVTTVTAFDLETADADQLFTYQAHDRQGFVRLAAWNGHVTADVGQLLGTLDRADEVVGHNILGYDLQVLAHHHGADYRQLAAKSRDTLVLARLADPPVSRQTGQAQRSYGLDALARDNLGQEKTADLEPLRRLHGGYDRIPLSDPKYQQYAQRDVHLRAGLAECYPMTPYGAREHQLLAIAGQMTLGGFRIDPAALQAAHEAQTRRRQELIEALPNKNPLTTHAGKRQLLKAFADLGVDLACNNDGLPKIGREQMDAVIASLDPGHKAVRLAQDVRELNGQRSILDQVRAHVVHGRVHARVDAGQATGRWSITNPGLTTLGKRGHLQGERSVFLPDPGEQLLVADLSQIDARAVGAHCQDADFLDLFLPGRDLHQEVATRVLGDPSKRDVAKILNHSVNYGIGAATLSQSTGLPRAVCQDYLDGMAVTYPLWAQWRYDVAQEARAGGLLDNGFGRKLRVDPERASTAGPAAIGQSCARDLLMEGLLRMDRAGLTPHLRCVIHDEVVLSVPTGDIDEVRRLVADCLTFPWAPPGASRTIDITCEVGARGSRNWSDAYK